MGSRNGTFVNGRRITSLDLQDGDILRIGDFTLRFQSQQEEAREVLDAGEPLMTIPTAISTIWGSANVAASTSAPSVPTGGGRR